MPATPELHFLPAWPIALGHFEWFALLLLFAAVMGEVASRVLRLPKMAGYLAAGLALGPYGFAAFDAEGLAQMRIFVDIALGLLLFELGHRLDLGWLRRNPWLLVGSVLEAGMAFGAVFGALAWLGVETRYAVTAAAIGMATSPAVAVRVTAELRAQGQVTERMLTLTALNNVYAVVTMTAFLGWQHFERHGEVAALLYPLYLVCASFLLAVVGAVAVRYLLDVAGRSEEVGFLMLAGAIILLITFALAINVSMPLCLLAFGTLAKHLDPRLRAIPRPFGAAGAVFIVVLFGISGVNLDFQALPTAGLLACGYIGARQLGKWAGVLATALPSGIGLRKAALLGAALCPMSGLAMALMLEEATIAPELGSEVGAILAVAVAVLELAGPVVAHFALIAAREANPSPRS
ncbi:MAG: cation:proton antiporter [Rhodocyclaceae bacterium]|nr:cation:proton antiporter [Rhodocyclaceae bacterium]